MSKPSNWFNIPPQRPSGENISGISELQSLVYHQWVGESSRVAESKCSDLAQGELDGQESKTLVKRIETLSDPSAEEAGESHAGRTAFGAARPPADFARDDQRTNTAFG